MYPVYIWPSILPSELLFLPSQNEFLKWHSTHCNTAETCITQMLLASTQKGIRRRDLRWSACYAVPLEIFKDILYTSCPLPRSTHLFIHLYINVSLSQIYISISLETDKCPTFNIGSVWPWVFSRQSILCSLPKTDVSLYV